MNTDHHTAPHSPQDEIDLVDIVAVLYKRKQFMALVFILVGVLATGYWFVSPSSLETTAVFVTGKCGDQQLISTAVSEQLLTSLYIPANIKEHQQSTGVTLNAEDIEVTRLSGGTPTPFVVVRAKTNTSALAPVINIAIKELENYHESEFERQTSLMSGLLESKKLSLSSVKSIVISSNHTATDQAMVLELESKILELNTLLSASYQSRILSLATESPLQKKGLLGFLFFGAVISFPLGCIFIFCLELLSKAKLRVEQNS